MVGTEKKERTVGEKSGKEKWKAETERPRKEKKRKGRAHGRLESQDSGPGERQMGKIGVINAFRGSPEVPLML